MVRTLARLAGALGTAVCAAQAQAGLGDPELGLDAVRQWQVQRTSPAGTPYTEQVAEQANGTRVTAWRTAAGQIVAVRWSGPFLPDLQAVLGRHFNLLARQAAGRGTGAVLQVRDEVAVVESTGRLGQFSGRAWLPAQLPTGLDPREMP